MATNIFPGIMRRLFRDSGKGPIIKEPVIPILEGGGLAYENEGDGIYVDFDTMDPKRFEDMLKALTIPIFLTGNKPFYVNGQTGSDDTSIEGIGESTDVPFKTIQACATYVATFYNMNTHYATIYVASGTYDETLSLGGFSATTGHVRIRPLDGEGTVTVSNTTTGNLVTVSNGDWRFYDMAFVLRAQPNDSNGGNHVHAVLSCSGGSVNAYDCSFEATDVTASTLGTDEVRAVWASSGTIGLGHSSGTTRSVVVTNNGRFNRFYALVATAGGRISLAGDSDSQSNSTLSVAGAYSSVLEVFNVGCIIYTTGSVYLAKIATKSGATCTGRKYYCFDGGYINTSGNGVDAGTEEGTVESSSYSWFH